MNRFAAIALLSLSLGVSAFAQSPVEAQYSAATGLGFNRYDAPQIKGWASFETRITDGTYNVSTLNMTSKLATLSTGVKHNFYTSGPVTLFGLVDGGIATGSGSTTGTFGGGGGIKLAGTALAKFPWAKAFASVPGSYLTSSVKIQQTGGQGVSPTFSFGAGMDFR